MSYAVFSQDEWIGIHSLADMWFIDEALEASKAWFERSMDSVIKLELGTRFDYDDWRREAFQELVHRPRFLSTAEARRIGLDATTQIARIREFLLPSMPHTKPLLRLVSGRYTLQHPNAPDTSFPESDSDMTIDAIMLRWRNQRESRCQSTIAVRAAPFVLDRKLLDTQTGRSLVANNRNVGELKPNQTGLGFRYF